MTRIMRIFTDKKLITKIGIDSQRSVSREQSEEKAKIDLCALRELGG